MYFSADFPNELEAVAGLSEKWRVCAFLYSNLRRSRK